MALSYRFSAGPSGLSSRVALEFGKCPEQGTARGRGHPSSIRTRGPTGAAGAAVGFSLALWCLLVRRVSDPATVCWFPRLVCFSRPRSSTVLRLQASAR